MNMMEGIERERQQQTMAEAVGKHVERMTNSFPCRVESINIFPNQDMKSSPEWMEWIIRYNYADGGGLTVGAILRTFDQERVEFHS